ncbi:MAG: hypothetical protein WEA10_00625 [Actinomycetota bacterium]
MAATQRSRRRRIERWFLGLGMSLVAFVLERRVIRSIKRRGEAPPAKTTLGEHGEHEVVQQDASGEWVAGPDR